VRPQNQPAREIEWEHIHNEKKKKLTGCVTGKKTLARHFSKKKKKWLGFIFLKK